MAAKGVLGDLNPLGDGSCRSLAGDGACVPKILPAAELEGSLTGSSLFGFVVADSGIDHQSRCRTPFTGATMPAKKGSIRDKVRALREKNAAAGAADPADVPHVPPPAAAAEASAESIHGDTGGERRGELEREQNQENAALREQKREEPEPEPEEQHTERAAEEQRQLEEHAKRQEAERQRAEREAEELRTQEEEAKGAEDARLLAEEAGRVQEEGSRTGGEDARTLEDCVLSTVLHEKCAAAGDGDGAAAQETAQEYKEEAQDEFEDAAGEEPQLSEQERLKLWREAARARAGTSAQPADAEQQPERPAAVALRGFDGEAAQSGRGGGAGAAAAGDGIGVWVADHRVDLGRCGACCINPKT